MQIGALIGKDNLSKYQHVFGFGELTGIDLPGDASTEGLLYTPENMDDASLATNSFGQNFNVTMTQLVSGFCSLINGGDYYEPHVVKQIQNENGNVIETKNPVLVKRTVSQETSTMVKDYMRGVVENGSGKKANLEGYEVGGKTGTAEKLPRDNGKYLVSFIGFAPVDDPALVIYVVVDEPKVDDQASSTYAQYIAQGILSEALPYLNVQPDEAEDGEVPTTELWELFKGISDSATGTGADGQKEAISDENVPSPPEDASEDSDTEDNNDMQSEGLTNEEAGLE